MAVVPVVRRPDYTLSLEISEGLTYVHCTVHRWSVTVARALLTDFERLYEMHGGPLYVTAHEPHSGDFEKWRKFVVHFGFRFCTTVTTDDGVRHSVYVREKCRF